MISKYLDMVMYVVCAWLWKYMYLWALYLFLHVSDTNYDGGDDI